MCGRTACALDPKVICQKCLQNYKSGKSSNGVQWNDSSKFIPSYNLAPGAFTPILISNNEFKSATNEPIIRTMQWGLVPEFAQSDFSKRFSTSNARIESLLDKPAYCHSMRKGQRCVVIAQGFYEWETVGSKKKPHFIRPSGKFHFYINRMKNKDPEKLLMMAGLYACHKGSNSNSSPTQSLYSYTVITTKAIGVVSKIHHRMPVILNTDEDVLKWLNFSKLEMNESFKWINHLARSLDQVELTTFPVTTRVNTSIFNCPECIVPLSEDKKFKDEARPYGSASILSNFLKRALKTEGSERQEIEKKPKELKLNTDYLEPSVKPENLK